MRESFSFGCLFFVDMKSIKFHFRIQEERERRHAYKREREKDSRSSRYSQPSSHHTEPIRK